MKYTFNCDRWGSSFCVPSKVVDNYIKLSSGDFVKVLLCILCSSERTCDTAQLAQKSGLSENTVIDAVTHWVSLGVITAQRSDGRQTVAVPSAVAVSAQNAAQPSTAFSQPSVPAQVQPAAVSQPVSSVEAVAPKRQSISSRLTIRYKNSEIQEKIKNDNNLKHLFDEIQTVLQTIINGTEQGELLALYEYYHFDAASILLAAEYCVSLEKRSIAYLVTVMRRWYEEDICSYTQIEQEIIRLSGIKKYENQILKIFGQTAKPSKRQLEMIDKWRSMGLTTEMMQIAYDTCVNNINKLEYNYINKVVTNWANNNITTPEQVTKEQEQFKNSKKRSTAKQPTGKKETSYDLSDFEEYAMNLDLTKTGKL